MTIVTAVALLLLLSFLVGTCAGRQIAPLPGAWTTPGT